jgi:hypothetical protein
MPTMSASSGDRLVVSRSMAKRGCFFSFASSLSNASGVSMSL